MLASWVRGAVSCSTAILTRVMEVSKSDDFSLQKIPGTPAVRNVFCWGGKDGINLTEKSHLEKTVIHQFGVFTAHMCPLIDRHFKIQLKLKMALVWGKTCWEMVTFISGIVPSIWLQATMFASVFVHCQGVKGINAFRCRNSSNDSLRRIFWVSGCVFVLQSAGLVPCICS